MKIEIRIHQNCFFIATRDITILLKHLEIAYPLSVYNNRYQEKVFRMTIPFASHFSNLLNKKNYIGQTIGLKSICESHCPNMYYSITTKDLTLICIIVHLIRQKLIITTIQAKKKKLQSNSE